ncbi:hypothetical protein Ancab_002933 [Ancistrocladus abbreviatus]
MGSASTLTSSTSVQGGRGHGREGFISMESSNGVVQPRRWKWLQLRFSTGGGGGIHDDGGAK